MLCVAHIPQILPVVVYFSCAIAILYYIGVMQFIIGKIAWVMQVTMGTAATESLIAAGNIFIGQVCLIICIVIIYLCFLAGNQLLMLQSK